ncbi:MAG TPA: DUF5777 family beta-barrel protein [Chitinophagaceae bacterium]|nr:DUF5777 family beta-barrel protein [Chitinophagaceae bacterium]
MKKILLLLVAGLSCWFVTMGQDTTEAATKEAPKPKYARATFNATKIINLQSTEIVSQNVLQFMVSHHFSYLWNKDQNTEDNLAQFLGINSGIAQTYLSFDYSVRDFANLGVALAGHSRYEGWAKFRIIRQQTGQKNYPVTATWYSMANVDFEQKKGTGSEWDKWSYLHQLLIARKMSDKISLQLVPSFIYLNNVPYGINNSNFVWSIGAAGKWKASPKMNVTMEYTRQLNMYENIIDESGAIINYSPDLLSLGIEINTGGHLFQFFVGNTMNSSNIDQLARNTGYLKDGNLAFGFTINRSMDLKKEKD